MAFPWLVRLKRRTLAGISGKAVNKELSRNSRFVIPSGNVGITDMPVTSRLSTSKPVGNGGSVGHVPRSNRRASKLEGHAGMLKVLLSQDQYSSHPES